ncbi:hypothetical protein, partial [Tistrella bauzanensis]|uniref:hypothetical protein n=1 Tax=Tistrella bauzanensis TaxID=657419 RepID=UPI00166A01FF
GPSARNPVETNGIIAPLARWGKSDRLLDENWQVLADAIKAKNSEQAREAFLLERTVCMSCHIAEGYEFINDTSIFKETESFPGD